MRLFKSYRPDYADGQQQRDFIYIKDCVEVICWLLGRPEINGLFNVGTGAARSWVDLAQAVFQAMGQAPAIEFVDMPAGLARQYQYFTQARMQKLASLGCPVRFRSLEAGVADYVTNYLATDCPYLTANEPAAPAVKASQAA
jgi:ADP-L-glycero-D-manno-heptose 6-epimerase